jgi:hypothetical protein
MSTQPQWTTPESIHAVRPQVKQLLTDIPAFHALPADEQRALAANMVKVMSYISNPNGVIDSLPDAASTPAMPRQPMAVAQTSGPARCAKASTSSGPWSRRSTSPSLSVA